MKLIYEFGSIRYLVCEKVAYNEVKTLIWNNTKYSHKPHVGKPTHHYTHTNTHAHTNKHRQQQQNYNSAWLETFLMTKFLENGKSTAI